MARRLERDYKGRSIKIQQTIDGGWTAVAGELVVWGETSGEVEERIKGLIDEG